MNFTISKLFLVLLILSAFVACGNQNRQTLSKVEPWQNEVGASSFPKNEQLFLVNSYLSNGIDNTDCTIAIQAAIDDCALAGGGVVYFEPGVYQSGSVFVKSKVNLQIDEGVTLLGIPDENAYQLIDTRVAGIEMEWPAALINFIDVHSAALTGKGTINGQGKYFWEKFNAMRPDYEARQLRWAVDYDCQRPRLVLAQNSSDISITGLRLEEPGFWTVHILYSDRVTIDGISIYNNLVGKGPSTDGVDIDSSTRVLVQNCYIDCNDDNICLKAGKDGDGLRVNRPTEYVVIRDCVSGAGGGLITFGSETSGSIRFVEVYNLKAKGTKTGIRFKSAKTRGGIVEEIYLHDIEMENVGIPFSGSLNWHPRYSYAVVPEGITEIPKHWEALTLPVPDGMGIPIFRNIRIKNLTATGAATAINVQGLEESLIDNIHFENVRIEAQQGGIMKHVSNVNTDGLTIIADEEFPFVIDVALQKH